jgi:protein tyrosine kinase modulator
MDENQKTLSDYLGMLRQRIWHILVPFSILFVVSVTVALILPPVYVSTGKVLIEDPDIPRELAVSTISSAADKRLQVISQRVMTTENLTRIIRENDLYPKERKRLSEEEVAEIMRKAVDMELIQVKSGSTAVAFTISFENHSAKTAQAVASELVALYLNENVRDRQFRASQTAAFFESETTRLEGVISNLEAQLAELRRTEFTSLPEQLEFNQKLIARSEEEMRDLDRQMQTIKERRIYLQSELAKLASLNQDKSPAAVQLQTLQAELATATGRYGPTHPDVVRLRREVDALEKQSASQPSPTAARKQLREAEAKLSSALERYTENHPEVVRLTREVNALRQSLSNARQTAPDAGTEAEASKNPAYLQFRAELQATDLELAGLARQRDSVRERVAEYERRVENTPSVQQTYQRLTRGLDAANAEYQEVRGKQMTAQMGELLESERKSERLSLIEAPTLPRAPIKPKRLQLMLLGFVLSVGGGVGCALLFEMLDTSVRSPRELTRLTGVPPLAAIPYIHAKAETRQTLRRRAALAAGSIAVVTAAVILLHVYVIPLGTALTAVQHRFSSAIITSGG